MYGRRSVIARKANAVENADRRRRWSDPFDGDHRIFEQIEQGASLNTAKFEKFCLGLPRARIGKGLLDITVAKHYCGAVGSLDERELPSVAPENAVRIALEFVDRHVGRFGFLGVVGDGKSASDHRPVFLIELAD